MKNTTATTFLVLHYRVSGWVGDEVVLVYLSVIVCRGVG